MKTQVDTEEKLEGKMNPPGSTEARKVPQDGKKEIMQ